LSELYAAVGAEVLEPASALEDEWREVVDAGWTGGHPELERLLDENADTLALLHERVGAAEVLAEVPSAGYEAARLLEARRVGQLLLLEGRRHQRRGRDDEALASALCALRLAHRHLHEADAPLIVNLVGQGLQHEALDAIGRLVHRSRVSDGAWRRALEEMTALRAAWPDLEPWIRSDTRFTRALIEEGFENDGMLDSPETQRVLEQLDVVTEEYLRRFVAAYREGRPDRLREELEERERELQGLGTLVGAVFSEEEEARLTAEVVVELAFANLVSVIETDMLNRMKLDMDRVAVAVRLSWLARGRRPPESLDELVPEYLEILPEDLFAPGTPLELARQGAHWWLYSVGPDRVDDGGMLRWPGTPGATGDVLSIPARGGAHRH
jgi:hypothetical protein